MAVEYPSNRQRSNGCLGIVQNMVVVDVVIVMGENKYINREKVGEYKYVLEDKEKARKEDDYREGNKKKSNSNTVKWVNWQACEKG